MNFNFLKLEFKNHIAFLTLNNAKKANALNEVMWKEIKEAMGIIDKNDDIHVCILNAAGKRFTSGIDINYLDSTMEETKKADNREEFLYKRIKEMQSSFSAIENSRVPVISAIHGFCIGGGVDLVAACDMRYSTINCFFSIMETKLSIVADMGTLQRLTRVIPTGILKELTYTSRIFSGYKAQKYGLVNKTFFFKKNMDKYVLKLAKEIASLPSNAVQGSKTSINYSNDHSVDEGLDHIAKMNSTLLMKEQTLGTLKSLKEKFIKP